jgi:hypothetical protein
MAGLGYRGTGDFGTGVATVLALDDSDAGIALHLTNLELSPGGGPEVPAPGVGGRGGLSRREPEWCGRASLASRGGYQTRTRLSSGNGFGVLCAVAAPLPLEGEPPQEEVGPRYQSV